MADPPNSRPAFAWPWLLLFVGYLVALFIGTHLPPNVASLPADQSDKALHFAAYTGLAFLLAMAWESSTGRLTMRHLTFAWLAIVAFAAFDEITQPLMHRDADSFDWLADAVGAAIGFGTFLVVRRVWSRI